MLSDLIKWSFLNYSDLPWRKNRTVYKTYVSEIMLQQTTVATVIPRFKAFIKKFPSLLELSQSSEKEVLFYWQGLGYYRRARNLRQGAIDLVLKYNGKFPVEKNELLKIKGIGEYTANAILAIGMNQSAIAVDANIERVLSRYYKIKLSKGSILKENIQKNIENKKYFKNFDKFHSRNVNESLMDLGRVLCQQNNVDCDNCPISKNCRSFKNKPLELPLKISKPNKKFSINLARILIIKMDKIYVVKRKSGVWLEGQWELPSFVIKTNDPLFLSKGQYEESIFNLDKLKEIAQFKTIITKYKITNYLYKDINETLLSSLYTKSKGRFINPNKTSCHLSSATLKALSASSIFEKS